MYSVILDYVSGRPSGSADVNFAKSRECIVFDVRDSDDDFVTNDLTLVSAKELLNALQSAIDDAERHEKTKPVAKDAVAVTLAGTQYYLPAGYRVGPETSPSTLMWKADLAIDSTGKVIKNRHGLT